MKFPLFQKEDHRNVVLGTASGGFLPRKEVLTEAELNHHVHIVGASGFGKTVLLSHIIKNKIQTGAGMLYVDLKGDRDTIQNITRLATDAGRLNDLQIFSLTDQDQSCSYNLIQSGTPTQLKDKILQSLNWSEEYYKNQSASFLLKLLIGLCHLRDFQSVGFDLGTILRCSANNDYVAEIILKVPKAQQRIKEAFEDCYNFLTDRENYKSLQGLRTQLESLIFSDFGPLLCPGYENQTMSGPSASPPSHFPSRVLTPSDFGKPANKGIDLFKSATQSKITCIFLDSRRYGETAKTVGRFLLQDLKMTSAKIDCEVPKSERKNFVCIIDEFADLAQEDFIAFLDRARSSKMAIVIAHQELSDLQRISKEFAARLIANSSTTYCFLQKNPESAELISGMAGTRLSKKTTDQTERFLWWDVPTGKKSTREVEEFIIHPNLIKSLPVGRCVSVKKYPYAKAQVVDISRGE